MNAKHYRRAGANSGSVYAHVARILNSYTIKKDEYRSQQNKGSICSLQLASVTELKYPDYTTGRLERVWSIGVGALT